MEELKHQRAEIDRLDQQILALLNQRYGVVKAIGEIKRRMSLETFAPERESELLTRLCRMNNGPMKNETTVAFLGPALTFSHQAALARFGSSIRYVPQQTIADVFEAVSRGRVNYGVVPVENSTEGAVTYTLDMFVDTTVKICAEVNMAVHHNLLGRCRKEELQVLYSHPQVLGQCRRRLHREFPNLPLVEVASTTEAASRCGNEPFAGALASALAADYYHLNILAENLEDLTDNVTRFLVLGSQTPKATGNDKTSVLFVVRDRVGALYDSLAPFRAHEINLTFIESRPSRRKSWEYYFFIDVLGHTADANVQTALEELGEHCQFVKILGSYPRAADASAP